MCYNTPGGYLYPVQAKEAYADHDTYCDVRHQLVL
jgi:hypothetical protein